jgi:hypothetical protein
MTMNRDTVELDDERKVNRLRVKPRGDDKAEPPVGTV